MIEINDLKKIKDGSFRNFYLLSLYPIFFIFFLLFAIFLFTFGANGFYAHKTKLNDIKKLQMENLELYFKIKKLEKLNVDLIRFDEFVIENELRKLPLKRIGEVFIRISDKKWIDNFANIIDNYRLVEKSDDFYNYFSSYKIFIVFISIFFVTMISVAMIFRNFIGKGMK